MAHSCSSANDAESLRNSEGSRSLPSIRTMSGRFFCARDRYLSWDVRCTGEAVVCRVGGNRHGANKEELASIIRIVVVDSADCLSPDEQRCLAGLAR